MKNFPNVKDKQTIVKWIAVQMTCATAELKSIMKVCGKSVEH